MTGDLTRYLLGSGALTLVLIALVQAALKLYENRTSLKSAKLKSDADEDAAEARWNASYRNAGEKHLRYDLEIVAELRECQQEINNLRRQLGLEARSFTPLPDPPPLFPPPEART